MLKSLILPLTDEELLTLEEMGRHHRLASFRLRARGVIALNAGFKPEQIAQILGKSLPSVYNWAKWWRGKGLVGLLNGRNGGRPATLTPEWSASAIDIARNEALTLAGIMQRLRERHPEMPDFSVGRLSIHLREHGMSFKRCRLSLKKTR